MNAFNEFDGWGRKEHMCISCQTKATLGYLWRNSGQYTPTRLQWLSLFLPLLKIYSTRHIQRCFQVLSHIHEKQDEKYSKNLLYLGFSYYCQNTGCGKKRQKASKKNFEQDKSENKDFSFLQKSQTFSRLYDKITELAKLLVHSIYASTRADIPKIENFLGAQPGNQTTFLF